MRSSRIRAIALAASIVATGALPGAVGAGVAAAPAWAAPSGFSLECTATVLGGAPDRSGGVLSGAGRGSCDMAGSFGAPWQLWVTVRLQAKVAGVWRTRAFARTSTADTLASTKRIPFVQAGLACSSSTTRAWRVRITVEARANEKIEVVLRSRSAVSPGTSLAC